MTYEEDVRNGDIQKWEKTKRWEVESYIVDEMLLATPDQKDEYSKVWGSFSLKGEPKAIPFWFLTLLTGMTTAATFPWRNVGWRFSLRTMLVFTTIVALILGVIIYSTKP